MMPRSLHPLLALAAALPLGACFARSTTPTIHHYRLSYESPRPGATAPLPVILRIAPLRIDSVYASEGLAYREDAYRIETYTRHRWRADPARMVTDLLQRDLAASGSFQAVQQGASTLASDYVLHGEIEEIEERVQPECSAHLALRFLLTRTNTRAGADSVAFQKSYSGDEATPCGRPEALVDALSRVLARISEELRRDIAAAASENAAAGADASSSGSPR